jgi:hypothetical protein
MVYIDSGCVIRSSLLLLFCFLKSRQLSYHYSYLFFTIFLFALFSHYSFPWFHCSAPISSLLLSSLYLTNFRYPPLMSLPLSQTPISPSYKPSSPGWTKQYLPSYPRAGPIRPLTPNLPKSFPLNYTELYTSYCACSGTKK